MFRCEITSFPGESQRTEENTNKIHKPGWLKIVKMNVKIPVDTVCSYIKQSS
jgi:hypothetical protein